jgi:general secretion pathway protein F
MAVFAYRAVASGSPSSGTIAADTPRQARDLLRERGLVVTEIEDYRGGVKKRVRGRKSSRYQGTLFIRELATLLGVGVPLLEALGTLAEQYRGRMAGTILLLRDRVAGGSSLAGAMREQADVFDDLAVSITAVGEDAGTLETSLERLAEFRERSQQFRGRIANALIYPAIVLTMAMVASLFLMTFVVPRILEPLIEQGQALPWPTRVVKGASDFVLGWWWALGIALVACVGALGATFRSEGGRRWWDGFVLRLPMLGELVRKQAIVRIAVVLGTLLKSGIVFVRALQITQATTKNVVLKDALARCERAVGAGGDIGDALRDTGAFPGTVVQVFSIGQQSGRMEEMLDRLANAYDQQVNSAAQRLTAVLEPLLIVMLAMVVLFLVMATVLPILEAGNAIQ